MITKVVKLRSMCTIEKFQYHLNYFINTVFHKSRYARIEVKLITSTGEIIVIGKPYYMDFNFESEIRGFKFYLSQYYEGIFEVKDIKQIVFTQAQCTRKDFLDHLRQVKENKI